MHRSVPEFLMPKPHTSAKYSKVPDMEDLVNVLYMMKDQRFQTRNFSGYNLKLTERREFLDEISERLHSAVPERRSLQYPTDHQSVGNYNLKLTESKLSEEQIQRLIERLSRYDPKKGPPDSRARPSSSGYLPQITYGSQKRSREDVDRIVARLVKYDETKGPPDSRGVSAEQPTSSEIQPSKSVDSDQLVFIIHRLTQYDSEKWPPESPQSASDAKSGLVPKKLTRTSSEIDKIVERLGRYDRTQWPPESKGEYRKLY